MANIAGSQKPSIEVQNHQWRSEVCRKYSDDSSDYIGAFRSHTIIATMMTSASSAVGICNDNQQVTRAVSITGGTGLANTSVCTWAAICCTITVYIWIKDEGVIE